MKMHLVKLGKSSKIKNVIMMEFPIMPRKWNVTKYIKFVLSF